MLGDDTGVYGVDVTDETEIHRCGLARDIHRGTTMRLHQAGGYTREPHRGDLQIAADRQDARVDEAVEHHGGGIDRFLIGYAPALHHARADAKRMSARMSAGSPNTAPPAFTTNTLPL